MNLFQPTNYMILLQKHQKRSIPVGNRDRSTETEALLRFSGGDAESCIMRSNWLYPQRLTIQIRKSGYNGWEGSDHVQKNLALYDKNGEQHWMILFLHYQIMSRSASDPKAAVYWLDTGWLKAVKMPIHSKENGYTCCEDIGLANRECSSAWHRPVFEAINVIGWPRWGLFFQRQRYTDRNLPKSNSAYTAIEGASRQ